MKTDFYYRDMFYGANAGTLRAAKNLPPFRGAGGQPMSIGTKSTANPRCKTI
jgi:hypothetical protein